MALDVSGWVKQKQGDFEQAAALHREGLALGIEIGSVMAMSWSLYLLARVATARAQPELATRFLGAVESLFDLTVDMESFERADYENTQATLRKQLGEERFLSALAEGRTKTPKHILADLELLWKSALTASPTRAVTLPSVPQTGLTSREMDVLRLLAQGLTSAQIAEQLIIGVVTVNFHVRSIYSKLGVTSRAAATRYAVEHHLV